MVKKVKARDFTLGSQLYDQKKRVTADYRLSLDDFNRDETFWFIEECKDFITKIKKIR